MRASSLAVARPTTAPRDRCGALGKSSAEKGRTFGRDRRPGSRGPERGSGVADRRPRVAERGPQPWRKIPAGIGRVTASPPAWPRSRSRVSACSRTRAWRTERQPRPDRERILHQPEFFGKSTGAGFPSRPIFSTILRLMQKPREGGQARERRSHSRTDGPGPVTFSLKRTQCPKMSVPCGWTVSHIFCDLSRGAGRQPRRHRAANEALEADQRNVSGG